MKNRVCVLTTAHQAHDVRIFYKECRSLAQAGYEVHLIASHHQEKKVDDISIIPLSTREGRLYRFLFKGWKVLWKAIKLRADVYHFHDPDLIPAGLFLKLIGKKVIYDVHEDVPEDILTKEWLGGMGVRKLVSCLFRGLLKFSSLFFDKIVAATPGISKGFPPNKTIVVRNVPYVSLIDDIIPGKIDKTKPSVIYAGGLTKIRGIKEIIDAIRILEGFAELWLLGWWEEPDFERECRFLDGWKYVRYFGLKSLEETYAVMKQADIVIVNFLAVPNSTESLPNKAFEYLNCGLPIIMSEFAYWKELFGKCALFVNPDDSIKIAENIKALVENQEQRMELIREGRKLIESEFSWESESRKLTELYKHLINDGGMPK